MGEAPDSRKRTRPGSRRHVPAGKRAALGPAEPRAARGLDAALLELRRAPAGSERASELTRVLISDLTALVPFTDPERSTAPLHGLEFELASLLDIADGRFGTTTGSRTHALRVVDGSSFTYCGQKVHEMSGTS